MVNDPVNLSDEEKAQKKADLTAKMQKEMDQAYVEYEGKLHGIERYARTEVEKDDHEKEEADLKSLENKLLNSDDPEFKSDDKINLP